MFKWFKPNDTTLSTQECLFEKLTWDYQEVPSSLEKNTTIFPKRPKQVRPQKASRSHGLLHQQSRPSHVNCDSWSAIGAAAVGLLFCQATRKVKKRLALSSPEEP